jgi:hypothetical protein
MISSVTRRIVWSLVLAIPLSFISFAVADSVRTPNIIRYLIAPGFVLSLHLSSGGSSFSESLSRAVWLALATDTTCYAVPLFVVLSWLAISGPGGSLKRIPTRPR